MRIRNLLIGIVCLVLLIASHWFAYYRGKKHGEKAFRSFIIQRSEKVYYLQLRSQVPILRAMVKHPDRFSQGEIAAMRIKGGMPWDRLVLPFIKETGDEAKVQEAQSLVDEHRELMAKLPK